MNAQLSKKVVFWLHTITGDIKVGLTENFPAPPFHEKIICHSARMVEEWSQKMRDQERIKQQMDDDRRGAIEEKNRAEIRSHIHRQMANARNNYNREFLRRYLEITDKKGNDPTKWKRESFMHVEGYEQGHD